MHGMPLKVHNNFAKPIPITGMSKKLCAGVMLDRLSPCRFGVNPKKALQQGILR